MALSDLALMVNHKAGREVCTLDQERWGILFTRWRKWPRLRREVQEAAPRLAAWMGAIYERWVAKGYRAHLSLKAHHKWPNSVSLAWGLAAPPSPFAVLRGFMRPMDSGTPLVLRRPVDIEPLSWAYWRCYTWGCDIEVLTATSGEREQTIVAKLAEVVEALMWTRLDICCWALNIDKATIPEGKLTPGWYARNEAWIRGQVAIGFPYRAADPRTRNYALKERTWPTDSQLANPPRLEIRRPMVFGTRLPRTAVRKWSTQNTQVPPQRKPRREQSRRAKAKRLREQETD